MKKSILILLLGSLLALLFAYVMEFGFEILPCLLCKYARIPFFFAIFFALLSYFKEHNILLYLGIFSIFCTAMISLVHAGIEYEILDIDLGCVATSTLSMQEIMAEDIFVPCNKIQFAIFGISLSVLNVIYCVFLSGLTIFAKKKYE